MGLVHNLLPDIAIRVAERTVYMDKAPLSPCAYTCDIKWEFLFSVVCMLRIGEQLADFKLSCTE